MLSPPLRGGLVQSECAKHERQGKDGRASCDLGEVALFFVLSMSDAPSKLRSFSLLMEVDGGFTRLAMGAWSYR